MELLNNPYFVLLSVVLFIGLVYVLAHQESIPGFVFLFMAGMGAFFGITGIGKVALLKAILLPILFVVVLFGRLKDSQRLPLGNLALLLLFMGVTVASAWLNEMSFELVRPYLGTLMVALVVVLCPDKEKTVRYLVVAIALWGLANLLAAALGGRGWEYQDAVHTGDRVVGLMGVSNVLGVYFVIALNAVHVLFFQARSNMVRLLLFAVGLGMAVGLMATLSRASFAAFLVSSLLIQYRLRGIRIGSLVGIAAAAVMVMALAVMFNLDQVVVGRFTTIKVDPSAQGRLSLVEVALKVVDEKPLFGIGLSQGGLGEKNVLLNSHNTYVQKLMENGIAGFSLFVLLLWLSLRALNKRSRADSSKEVKPYYVGLLGMLVAILVNGLFHDLTYLMPLWILVGIGLML